MEEKNFSLKTKIPTSFPSDFNVCVLTSINISVLMLKAIIVRSYRYIYQLVYISYKNDQLERTVELSARKIHNFLAILNENIMGTEMKAPESSENVLRNRKQKSAPAESVEKTVKNDQNESVALKKNDNKMDKMKIKEEDEKKSNKKLANDKLIQTESEQNFTIKIEFDPMSIALFALAIITRFFRLSEPKNVV